MQTVSGLSQYLIDVWSPGVTDYLNKNSEFLKRFGKGQAFPAGNQAIHRIIVRGNNSPAPWADNGETAVKDNITIKEFKIDWKYIHGQGKLTLGTIIQGAGNLNMASDVLTLEQENLKQSLNRLLSIYMYGDGTGRLGKVSATNGTTTITLDGPYDLARYFRPGMTIAVQVGNTATPRATTCVISAVNYTTNVLTVDTVPSSTADNDIVVMGLQNNGTSYGNAPWGFMYHFDDGSNITTYQGQTRSDYAAYKAGVIGNGGALTALTEQLMYQGWIKRTLNSDRTSKDPIKIIMCPDLLNTYNQIYANLVRLNAGQIQGGSLGPSKYKDITIEDDANCPYHTIFFEDPVAWEFYEGKPFGLVDVPGGNGTLLRPVGTNNKFEYEYAMLGAYNLGNRAPNTLTKVEDISHDVTAATNQ